MIVACVLKSGGDYDVQYVEALRDAVARNLSIPYEFVCWTDDKNVWMLENVTPISSVLGAYGLPGWWNKVLIFWHTYSPVLYLDLDTIILSSLDPLAEAVISLTDKEVLMLRPFNPKEMWASGIMGFNGDHTNIPKSLTQEDMNTFIWDQRYIRRKFGENNVVVKAVQEYLPGVVSFKRHCLNGLPEGASVVAFHGHPRPHQVKEELEWVRRFWHE